MSKEVKYIIEVDENGAGAKVAALFANGAKAALEVLTKPPAGGTGTAAAGPGATEGGTEAGSFEDALKPALDVLHDIRLALRTVAMQSGGGNPPGGSGGVTNTANITNIAGSGGGGVGGNLLHYTNNLLQDMLLVVKTIAMQMGGGGGGGNKPEAKPEANKKLKKLLGGVDNVGGNALDFAADPAGGMGNLGSVAAMAGGPVGMSIAAIAKLGDAAIGATMALANYNGQLFEAATEFNLTMEGLKYQLAGDLAEPLSKLTKMLSGLLAALEPVVVFIVDILAAVLEPLIWGLTKLVQVVDYAISGIKLLVAAIAAAVDNINPFTTSTSSKLDGVKFMMDHKMITPNESMKMVDKIMKESPEVKLDDALREVAKAQARLTGSIDANTEELRKNGQAIMLNLFHQVEATAHGKAAFAPGMGPGGKGAAVPNAGGFGGIAGGAGGKAGPAGQFNGRPQLIAVPVGNNISMSPAISLHASDYDKLHDEMLALTSRVWEELRGMHGSNWLKLATARASTRNGVGV